MLSKPIHIKQDGFSMIEAIVAIFLMTVALIGTAAALTFALEFGALSRNVTEAKTMIESTMEEIETLRNARRLDFKQVANAGSVDNTGSTYTFSGFTNGFQQVSDTTGPDGVTGTADDLVDAGPDGTYGTGDDFTNADLARRGYSRSIQISDVSTTIKKIEIRVRYFAAAGKTGEIRSVAYLNDEARTTGGT